MMSRGGPLLVTIEGGIGVGKSTVMQKLREHFWDRVDVVFVDEPVELWREHGILQAAYEGRLNAGVFQHCALMSRVGSLLDALRTEGVSLVISERSPFSDRYVFANANLSGLEREAYMLTYKQLIGVLPKALEFRVVLLEAPSDVLMGRIARRNRSGESLISPEYLYKLDQGHVAMKNEFAERVSVIDATASIDAVAQQVKATILHLIAPA